MGPQEAGDVLALAAVAVVAISIGYGALRRGDASAGPNTWSTSPAAGRKESTVSPTPTQQVEKVLIDFVKTAYEADKPAVLAAITAAEGGAQGFLVNAIKDAPRPPGLLGMLFGTLEPWLEDYVAGLLEKAGPAIVYAFIDSELARLDAAV